jgi:alkanesulfonate monooxygenase SsuD/methylene tetrahydromethanopterin reductase-like flavin-dependent oxidoreductase (luciferase family)
MRFGVAVPAYGRLAGAETVRRLAAAAEADGYDGVWFADHLAVPDYATKRLSPPFFEPVAACAWVLGASTSLRVGTDVLVAPYRHPLHVAASIATLAHLAPNRVILGVGIGYLRGEFDALGAGDYERRGARTDRWLEELRRAWAGEGDLHVLRPPPDTAVPVWIGGNGQTAQRRAARLGNGWHPLATTPEVYAEARARITEWRASNTPFAWSYSCPTVRLGDRSDAPSFTAPEGEWSYAPPPWVAPGGRARFTGTADDLIEDFSLLAGAGVEHAVVRFRSNRGAGGADHIAEQMAAFAESVRPLTR